MTQRDVENMYLQGIREVYLEDDTILLPGAKDALKSLGMKVREGRDCQNTITTIVDQCYGDNLDEGLKEKITKAVIAKYMAKLGGE